MHVNLQKICLLVLSLGPNKGPHVRHMFIGKKTRKGPDLSRQAEGLPSATSRARPKVEDLFAFSVVEIGLYDERQDL